MQWEDLIFVEDTAAESGAGEVVSSLCLIPWRLAYGAATLTVGEMGIVGTDERWRNRGLVRAQLPLFWQRFGAHGCTLSLIQGIPFYYRQFGYTYALALEGGIRVDARSLPPLEQHPFTFRLATTADIPVLATLYDEAVAGLAIHAVRDEATWRFMLGPQMETLLRAEWWLVEAGGRPEGYLRLPHSHFGAELAVYEVSRLSYDAALAALHQLQSWADARSMPGVRLNLSESSLLYQLARSLGGHELGRYAWQVAIPDVGAFLTAIAPELSRRLAASPHFANWSGDLPISLYRSGAVLHITQPHAGHSGPQIQVTAGGVPAAAALQLPPDAFTPLVLGWRALDEIQRFFPDAQVDARLRPLIETLFPPTPAYIYAAT
jgi:hypothetical protein